MFQKFFLLALAVPALSAQTPEPWLKSSKLAEGVWVINDNGSDNMYLVEGRERALLIDTGLGIARLTPFLKTLTSKPVTVVNTHGHPDHAGGNFEFQSAYAHPAEFAAIRSMNTPASRSASVANASKNGTAPDRITPAEAAAAQCPELLPVREGHRFDLGGRYLEVIYSIGHTPGEIVLLDAANKQLFTGDNSNSLVWLFLPNSEPLDVYLTSLKKLNARSAEYATIFPGHGGPMPASFITEQIGCVERILDGTSKDEAQPYKPGLGVPANGALVTRYKSASVAYNPAKLRTKN